VKPTTYVAVLLIVAGAVAAWRQPADRPEPNANAPDAATRAIVANVREILSGHQEDGKRLTELANLLFVLTGNWVSFQAGELADLSRTIEQYEDADDKDRQVFREIMVQIGQAVD
jgi:hypothetical protein